MEIEEIVKKIFKIGFIGLAISSLLALGILGTIVYFLVTFIF